MMNLDQIADKAPPGMGKTIYLLRRLKGAGEPITISVNGKGNLRIADEGSYGMLLGLIDRLETIEAINEGNKELDEGKGLNLEEVKEQARERCGKVVSRSLHED